MRKAGSPLLSVARLLRANAAIRREALVGRRIFPTQSAEPTDLCRALALARRAETSVVLRRSELSAVVPYRPLVTALACLPRHTPDEPCDKVEPSASHAGM